MQREFMPDYGAEAFYQHLVPKSVFSDTEDQKTEVNHCVVLCKKVAPNVFDIRKGVAVVDGTKKFFNNGICIVAHEAKIVFVLE